MAEQSQSIDYLSGTELLMEILSSFGQNGEPLAMLVVWTDTAGDVRFKTNCVNTHALGLAQHARDRISQIINQSEY